MTTIDGKRAKPIPAAALAKANAGMNLHKAIASTPKPKSSVKV